MTGLSSRTSAITRHLLWGTHVIHKTPLECRPLNPINFSDTIGEYTETLEAKEGSNRLVIPIQPAAQV